MLDSRNVHFVGIGGIGISAIARMLVGEGVNVSGSDNNTSPVIEELKKIDAHVSLGHSKENVPNDCDLVIYTNALKEDNVELVESRNRGIRTISYPEALGEISKTKFTIAISGNAGKTTTTAMIGQVMLDAGLEPTIVVGSLANFVFPDGKTMRTNFVSGKGKYFVVEADEYKRAFLNLEPKILVITNVSEDHLDYYKDLTDIQNAFRELATKVPKSGFIVCAPQSTNVIPVINSQLATIEDYHNNQLAPESISIPGEHNRENAKVAISIGTILGIKKEIIEKSLKNFKGPWRRLEYKGKTRKEALVYDDYAHNPAKVQALISGGREKFPDKRIIVVFQPHLYSRTKELLSQFSTSFVGADRVIVTPIYASREAFDPTISHLNLLEAIAVKGDVKQVEAVDSLDAVTSMLEGEEGNTVIFMVGAGDIYKIAEKIVV